jgi:tRNA A37 N6-isopentenylltransferase MiaA
MMDIVPISFKEACEFVRQFHRHHRPPQGHKYSIACSVNGNIVGVAIVGRPVSRMLDNGFTLEVTRLCTDGTKNVCSLLYATAWRAARAMGYKKMVTYVLQSESGTSLRASGWKLIGEAGGGKWSRVNRPRFDTQNTEMKLKFEIS